MGTQILDGTGKGYRAQVDDHGRLYVRTNHVSHQAHHASAHKDFFYTNASTVLQGNSETPCMLIINDGIKDCEIYCFQTNSDGNFTVEIQ